MLSQDHLAWETQGPIADRSREHLSDSDRGVVLLRRVLKEQIERVQRGENPLGVIRDPQLAMIDTNVDEDVWRRECLAVAANTGNTWAQPGSGA